MKTQTLNDLLVYELSGLHEMETELGDNLPKLAKKAKSDSLQRMLKQQAQEATQRAKKIESVFNELKASPMRVSRRVVSSMLKDCENICSEDTDESVRDAALIGTLQNLDHYAIAGYGTACAHAQELKKTSPAKKLRECLEELQREDKSLSDVAMKEANRKGVHAVA